MSKQIRTDPSKITPQRLTAKGLAEILGVSQSTVSLALSDSSLVNIETRGRVKEAAIRFHYRRNRIARAMRTGRTCLVAMIIPSTRFSFYPEIIDTIETAAREQGAQCLICQSHGSPDKLNEIISILIEQQVDGLILTPLDGFEKSSMHQHLAELGMPVVFCDYDPKPGGATAAVCDNAAIGRMMANHLLDLGHRKIVFLQGNRGIRNYRDRYEGFQQAMKEAGVPVRPELIRGYDGGPEGKALDTLGDYTKDGVMLDGGAVVLELLDQGHTFTAIAAAGDLLAIPAVRALGSRGIRVPEEISVIGCGNLDIDALIGVPLTTIDQQAGQIGREAVKLLFRKISDSSVRHRRILIEPQLILRQSTTRRM